MRENAELSLQLETTLGDCRRQLEATKEKSLLKVLPEEISWEPCFVSILETLMIKMKGIFLIASNSIISFHEPSELCDSAVM